jgi:aminocarboxymuconate-semialdehyde decarboxylase
MADPATPDGAVDIHAHYFPPDYVQAARAHLTDPGVPPDATGFLTSYEPLDNDPVFTGALDERLGLMDAAEISIQVLSYSAGNVWHPDAATRSELVSRFNDGCADVVHRHPERFRLFANMPLPFVDRAMAETTRAIQLPGYVGVSVCTHTGGIPIDDPRWAPLYEMWNDLGTVVFVHPDGFCAPDVLGGHFLGWALGAVFDDTIAAVRLMASGTLERYPGITWIIPHCGGTLPFLMERIDRVWHSYRHLLTAASPPRESVKRLLVDSAFPWPEGLRFTMDVLGPRALLFGTDFPFANRADLSRAREDVVRSGIPSDDVAHVLFRNAGVCLDLGGAPARA